MNQDERWLVKYKEVVDFINTNHRNPSKYVDEERSLVNFCKHCRKQMNAGILKPERVEKFNHLLEMIEKYKRVNQWK